MTTIQLGGTVIAFALVLGLAAASTSATAQGDDDMPPKALVCTFTNGTSVTYESGNFTSKTASPLSFSITKIDLEGQSAALTAGDGTQTVNVRIIRAVNANHFLEVVNEGFLNLTTVYDKDSKTGLYPAVHSRHLGVLGQPVFGQYTGTCKE
jgi:hypothetical protein